MGRGAWGLGQGAWGREKGDRKRENRRRRDMERPVVRNNHNFRMRPKALKVNLFKVN
jgi:hypothetical protein